MPNWFHAWIGPILTAGIAALSVIVTQVAMNSRTDATNEARDQRLERIEAKLDQVGDRVGGLVERVVRVEVWQESQRLPLRR